MQWLKLSIMALILLSGTATAADSVMQSLPDFTMQASDTNGISSSTPTPENVYRSIFGGVADYAVFSVPEGEMDTALASMFMVFNLATFSVLVWLIFAFLMQKVLVSGASGQVQSSKYNDTMSIIRALSSLCGLLPVVSGFCLAQVLVAFMGMQASWIANLVNTEGQKYTFVNGGVTPYRPDALKINRVIASISKSTLCAAAVNDYYKDHPLYDSRYKVELKDNSSDEWFVSDTAHFKLSYENAEGDAVCGEVEMTVDNDQYLGEAFDPTGIWGTMNEHQIQLRNRIVESHKQAVIKTHNTLFNGITAGVIIPGQKADLQQLSAAYANAKETYNRELFIAFREGGQALEKEWNKNLEGTLQKDTTAYAAKRGWIYNGFTWLEKSRAQNFLSKLGSQAPAGKEFSIESLEDEFISERFTRTLHILNQAIYESQDTFESVNANKLGNKDTPWASDSEAWQQLDTEYLMSEFYKDADAEAVFSNVSSSMMKTLLVDSQFNFKDYDPITNLQHLGYRMTTAGFSMIFLGVYLDSASAFITNKESSDSALRTVVNHVSGGLSEGGIAAAGAFLENFVSMIFSIGPILIAIGSVLAYWLPALPFFMWDLAVLGNYLLVIVAFMAAPLWMAAHAMPDGDGYAGDHAKQGWITMITILARPSIMVMTWHVAQILMREMGHFTSLFLEYAPMANSESFSHIWGALVMVIIYVMFELVIVYRCTSLIYEVPDQIPIYYGSTTSTAHENIGENKGQTMIAGWQSNVQHNVGAGAGGTGANRQQKQQEQQNNLLT